MESSDIEEIKSTDDKIKVYRFFADLVAQFLLLICSQVAFFWILYFLLTDVSSSDTRIAILATLDLILQGTVFYVYKYYFNRKN